MIAETGTAKPTPELEPESVSICSLMPSTRAPASSSGPPELPGLIEASVWIAPSIWNLVSDSTERSVAETTPTESDCCSPKGLPIAATGWPTTRSLSSPNFSGCSSKPSGLTSSRATSAKGSKPTIFAGTMLRSGNSMKTSLAALRAPLDSSVTTWALVTMWPLLSSTKPEPSAAPPSPRKIERIVTTPGEASRKTRAASKPCSAVCTATCGAASVTVVVWLAVSPLRSHRSRRSQGDRQRRQRETATFDRLMRGFALRLHAVALGAAAGAGSATAARERGRSSVKAVKRLLEAIATRPSMRWASSRAIARPSPEPPAESAV